MRAIRTAEQQQASETNRCTVPYRVPLAEHWLMLPSQLTSIYSRNFSCGTGLRALTACLRIPDWPRRLVSNFAHITAGLGGPKMSACPSYWESPTGNAKLHRILRFRMGSHHLPVEEGRHFNLPRASRVCNLCNTDALGDERHMLLECPALADLRLQFSSLLLPCSGVMRRLLWAKDQHEVCRYIIACLDRMSSH